jgi:hypothetical protein
MNDDTILTDKDVIGILHFFTSSHHLSVESVLLLDLGFATNPHANSMRMENNDKPFTCYKNGSILN